MWVTNRARGIGEINLTTTIKCSVAFSVSGLILPLNRMSVFVHRAHQKEQQHHICVVAHTCYMQGCPQVLVLLVDIKAPLDQKLSCKHVIMAGTLQKNQRPWFPLVVQIPYLGKAYIQRHSQLLALKQNNCVIINTCENYVAW